MRAAPVEGGMGMHLLQKMGWTPGQGLGKEGTGTLQPLLLEVKLDTRGLQAKEEVSSCRRNRGVSNTFLFFYDLFFILFFRSFGNY